MRMKPETIKRRAAARTAEVFRRRSEAVERLTANVAHHEAKGDLKTAAFYAEMLVEAQDRLHQTETHVTVGDHDPEPRHD